MNYNDNDNLQLLLEDWASVWRPRTLSDSFSTKVGIPRYSALCLLHLLAHYPWIVYLCYSWWRKLLIPPNRQESFEKKDHEVATSSGRTGNLKMLDTFHLSMSLLQSEQYDYLTPAVIRHLVPQTENSDPEESTRRFLRELLLCDQVDALALFIKALRLDLRWAWCGGADNMIEFCVKEGTSTMLRMMLDGQPGYGCCPPSHRPMLLDKEASWSCYPPVHLALNRGKVDHLAVLLQAGARTETRLKTGETPLHKAVSIGSAVMTKLLLRYGADLKAKDKLGRTPLFTTSCPEMMEVLLSHGAE